MKEYHKLVRDKIPDLIRQGGETPHIRILEDEEYLSCLKAKLQEEVAEYLESGELMELADILEVVCALAEAGGASREALTAVCLEKKQARGGFKDRVFLISKE